MTESHSNGNGNGFKSKLSQLMPEDRVRIELLRPDGDRVHEINCDRTAESACACPGIWFVFDFLDGKTKQEYDRVMEKGVLRGSKKQGGYNVAIANLFRQKCVAIEGLTADECDGLEPKDYFAQNPKGRIMMKTATNEYLNRSLPSSAEDDAKN